MNSKEQNNYSKQEESLDMKSGLIKMPFASCRYEADG